MPKRRFDMEEKHVNEAETPDGPDSGAASEPGGVHNLDTASEKDAAPKKDKAQKPGGAHGKDALTLAQEELAAATDRLLRLGAEFDNFKKRTERERLSAYEYSKAATVKPLLPVLDNIDLALTADSGSPDYTKGVEMTVRQLKDVLFSLGLEFIDPENTPFDPNFHEAVMHIQDETLPENTVIQVLQKGYKMGDNVLRPAMVKVAN